MNSEVKKVETKVKHWLNMLSKAPKGLKVKHYKGEVLIDAKTKNFTYIDIFGGIVANSINKHCLKNVEDKLFILAGYVTKLEGEGIRISVY
jgi:hypothetical protein